VSDNCVLPTLEHSSVGRAAVLETGPLPLQDHKSGTVCRPILDYVGCRTASSGGYWRHFYPDSEATAQCELFLTAPNRNILTYLRQQLNDTIDILTLLLAVLAAVPTNFAHGTPQISLSTRPLSQSTRHTSSPDAWRCVSNVAPFLQHHKRNYAKFSNSGTRWRSHCLPRQRSYSWHKVLMV